MKPADVVQACAEQRAASTRQHTIADAIEEARFYRRTPEAIMDSHQAKRCIETLLSALERSTCYLNAVARGQGVFVLVQQDRAAPAAIEAWAAVAKLHGCNPEKVESAFVTAHAWRSQSVERTKWPD